MNLSAFDSVKIGNLLLKNRIVRSATYEGASDMNGFPTSKYSNIYEQLARNDVGMIISGFSYISRQGRAMQGAQAGIDSSEKIQLFRDTTQKVHEYNCPIILQLAHTGRQSLESVTGAKLLSSSTKKSPYFRQKPTLLTIADIYKIISQFADSAFFAKEAGFDGVQLHAAHGYLLHQLMLPETNQLKNGFGIEHSTGISTKIIEIIYDKIKKRCGSEFPVLIKISGNHDLGSNFFPDKFVPLLKFIDSMKFAAVEISYGTMDYAMNIFRGDLNIDTVFKYNPIFRAENKLKKMILRTYTKKYLIPKFYSFSPLYNLQFAEMAKKITKIPIISVGGFRSKMEIEYAISNNLTDLVGMSRPFISEPDLVRKMKDADNDYVSLCTNCNECVLMCDSGRVTACYRNNNQKVSS